jgi:hypothetical protein
MIATDRPSRAWSRSISRSSAARKRRKDGRKPKRGKGTAKPRILIAVQRDDRMRATVVPSEKADDIHAALDGVVAQPEARRPKVLKGENAKLKRLPTEAMLEVARHPAAKLGIYFLRPLDRL